MASLIFSTPVANCTSLSKPSPKPAWGTGKTDITIDQDTQISRKPFQPLTIFYPSQKQLIILLSRNLSAIITVHWFNVVVKPHSVSSKFGESIILPLKSHITSKWAWEAEEMGANRKLFPHGINVGLFWCMVYSRPTILKDVKQAASLG